jgi:HK97 family phage major capsid protein
VQTVPQLTIDQRAFDELATAVAALTQSVTEMKAGKVGRETVERIAEEVLRRQGGLHETGYLPEDTDPANRRTLGREARQLQTLQGQQRLDAVVTLPARLVADTIGRPVDDVAALQQAADELLILGAIRKQASDYTFDVRETDYYQHTFRPRLQAMDTATVAEGKEYIPTMLSSTLIDRVQLELLVGGLLWQIEMPSNPYEVPGLSLTRQRGGKAVEQTADTGQTGFRKVTPATRKVALTAMKFAIEVLVSKEAEEDAIVPMLGVIQSELVDYISADLEDAIINGDTAGTMDTGWTATIDPRLNFDGLRKNTLAAAKADIANVALTSAFLRASRKRMGVYGARADQLVHVVSMASYINLLADTVVQTLKSTGQRPRSSPASSARSTASRSSSASTSATT